MAGSTKDAGAKITNPTSVIKTGKKLKAPSAVSGGLERRFFERFGRKHASQEELDAFAASLFSEGRQDAATASRNRMDIVTRVLGHNLDERARSVSREEHREDLLMQLDKKFRRRMIREWKKEQPHGMRVLDKGGQEWWLPGSVIPNPGRKIRFRSKQEAIDFTQENKPQRPDATVPAADLESVIDTMVRAEDEASKRKAAASASAPVNAASKAGDAKTGPLYDYKFKRREGEGFDAMMKRLDSEIDAAANAQFAEARAAREQRAREREARRAARTPDRQPWKLTMPSSVQPPAPSAPQASRPVTPEVPKPSASTAPSAPLARASAPVAPAAKLPEPSETTKMTTPAAKKTFAERWPLLAKADSENAARNRDLDVFAKSVEAKSKTDPFYTKSAERAVLDETVGDIRSGNFGRMFRRFKQGVKFTLNNDFGVDTAALSSSVRKAYGSVADYVRNRKPDRVIVGMPNVSTTVNADRAGFDRAAIAAAGGVSRIAGSVWGALNTPLTTPAERSRFRKASGGNPFANPAVPGPWRRR